MKQLIRIATRQSPLALWQSMHVKAQLEFYYPGICVELVPMVTKGDKFLDAPLAKVGGKGLFVKELEQGMLADKADLAVHSLKDVPITLPPGLMLGAILPREDARDAWVSTRYESLSQCVPGTRIGTSSLRRQCQLRSAHRQIECVDVRGNVGTRLQKLQDGEYDALVLASAGLKRLGLTVQIRSYLSPHESLPAIGQGAIAIECRQEQHMQDLLAPLNCDQTADCVAAERALNERLEGGCQIPIAGYATLKADEIHLSGLVGKIDGSEILRAEAVGSRAQAKLLGLQVAESLLGQGAAEILAQLPVSK